MSNSTWNAEPVFKSNQFLIQHELLQAVSTFTVSYPSGTRV